jgi:hypothetical protein
MNVKHFQYAHKSLIFQSANEYDDSFNNIRPEFKYPGTEVRTNGFTGHLNVGHQVVKYNQL